MSSQFSQHLWVLTTPGSFAIGAVNQLTKLQKTKFSFPHKIGKFEYLKDLDMFIGIFDDYSNGKTAIFN